MSQSDQEYEEEAQRYFEALDYAFEKYAASKPPVEIPAARVVRQPWWRRLLSRLT